MIDSDYIAKTKAEIAAARANFVQQIEAIRARVLNCDGALELIAMQEKQIALQQEQADARAVAEAESASADEIDPSVGDDIGPARAEAA